MSVLQIESLEVRYPQTRGGEVVAVQEFSLQVGDGECVGVVGESGAGKSQAFLAAMGLLSARARVKGSVKLRGQELIGADAATLNRIRGAGLTMVFQDPLTSLTPHLTVCDQITEQLRAHAALTADTARERALELLASVQITDPGRRLTQYPHELSGGMRQRVMIAMALACSPDLVIADEPTTSLDVTIQAQIIRLLATLKRDRAMSLVLITHDLGIVAGIADRVVVMQAGRIVEEGAVRSLLKAPTHPHTQALLAATPRLDDPGAQRGARRPDTGAVLEAAHLSVAYATRVGGWRPAQVNALNDVDLRLAAGGALGIVGESGCGKSTLARAALRLLEPSHGTIVWMGKDVSHLHSGALRPLRRDLQIVFQDPLASLDPRMTVEQILTEPLRVRQPRASEASYREAAIEALHQVALPAGMRSRYPHELSGGQAQRIGIARAMIVRPRVLVCDEAVSSLDVTTQAQILALIDSLRRTHGLALVFISHNLAVVKRMCDRVMVLYLGRMMEAAPTEALYLRPAHPYTRALLDAIPVADPDLQPARLERALGGELPSPLAPPCGCVFNTRCPFAIEVCRRERPPREGVGEGRWVSCHRWREWPALAPIDSDTRHIQS